MQGEIKSRFSFHDPSALFLSFLKKIAFIRRVSTVSFAFIKSRIEMTLINSVGIIVDIFYLNNIHSNISKSLF